MAPLTLSETMDRLLLLIRAGYPVIYVRSHEETRVLDYLAKIFRVVKAEQPNKHFLRWYEGIGLEEIGNLTPHAPAADANWLMLEGLPPNFTRQGRGGQRADEALTSIKAANMQGNPSIADSLTVFFDIHRYLRPDALQNGAIAGLLVRPLRNAADALRQYYEINRGVPGRPYKTIVIVAPSAAGMSAELDRDLIVIDFPLPATDELLRTLGDKIDHGNLMFPSRIPAEELIALCDVDAQELEAMDKAIGDKNLDDQRHKLEHRRREIEKAYEDRLRELIAGAGRGLTLEDYKLGLNMFAVRHEPLCARHIEDMLNLKSKAINSQALQYTPHVNIELGGLKGVREWVRLRRDAAVSVEVRRKYHLPSPKGVMLCGVSGGGKSQLAKLIAKEFNLALLRLDVGALFGMYVGESEERTRMALQLAEVLAPVVLWLDEIDKAFNGMGGGGDNGVSARVFGHFLTWLAEKQDSVFVVATANDFRALLDQFPEFGRKGRFDEIFWVDLPDEEARRTIFQIYLQPLLEEGYLVVTDDDIAQLTMNLTLPQNPVGEDAFAQLCWILSHALVSGNMTGAEIEYAVATALYNAYQADRASVLAGTFTPATLAIAVQQGANRALYLPGSQAAIALVALRGLATANNWMIA